MSASTRPTRSATRPTRSATRPGIQHDLAEVAEKIRDLYGLSLGDLFCAGTGLHMIRTALARYRTPFLAKLADTRPLAETETLLVAYADEPAVSFWELCRRRAAAAVLLHLREEANRTPRIIHRDLTAASPWVFLGFMERDRSRLPLTETQLALLLETDLVAELWARRDDGAVQVFHTGIADGNNSLYELPGAPSDDPHIIEARKRHERWETNRRLTPN